MTKMRLKAIYLSSFLFVALALGPSMAHLLELPHKISLPRDEYLIVQQIYRGWALLGIVVAGELLSVSALTISLRRNRMAFTFASITLFCIIGAQVLFWVYTYPANQATLNWTMLPENWEELRRQWEYSHAAGAILNLLAIISLTLPLLAGDDRVIMKVFAKD